MWRNSASKREEGSVLGSKVSGNWGEETRGDT